MSVRTRVMGLVVAAFGLSAVVGCGDDAVKDPKKPDNAPTLKQQIPAGGGPGGGGKPAGPMGGSE